MSKYVIGIDFGSDSVRALVVDTADGKEISTAVVYYPRWKNGEYCNPSENRYRQHPLDHVESLEACVKEALKQAGKEVAAGVVGLSIDATASTIAITDKEGTPLALLPEFKENPNAMFVLWKDHTAIDEADRINDISAAWKINYVKYCGGTYSCEWAWSKALHLLRVDESVRAKAYSWVEHGDWIVGVLAGNTKPETMARSRCIAGHKAMWHESWGGLPEWDFLETVDPLLNVFKGHLFKDTVTCDKKIGTLCREWAERLGLSENVALGVGAIDCHVGAVGAGIKSGTLVKVMGTSTCDIAVGTYSEVADKAIRGICGQVDGSVLPGLVGMEAGQSAFGDVYAWFKRFTGRDLVDLTDEARQLPLTENDIVALDWFNGRRTPDADPRAKAAIVGLTMGTTPAQVFKALVEATAFGSRAINERFSEEGVKIKEIVAVGGISRKSSYVMQIMADVMGVPIKVLDSDQACALGDAMFAAVTSGVYPDMDAAQSAMCPGCCAVYKPDSKRNDIYNTLYQRYRMLKEI